MKELLGREIEMGAVEDRIAERFAEVFGMEMDGHEKAQKAQNMESSLLTIS